MDRDVTVVISADQENEVLVYGNGDPWEDLAVLLEGVGVLVAGCANNGKVSHNEQTVENYLKDYISKVCGSYETTRPINQRN